MDKLAVFTLTQGRTGTSYVTELLRANCQVPGGFIHEMHDTLAYDNRTPDVGLMRQFNDCGNIPPVQMFWWEKFHNVMGHLNNFNVYVETNHTLAKAGLLENLESLQLNGVKTKVILLRRNPESVIRSMLNRGDMINKATTWLFYLDPDYRCNLIDSEDFKQYGQMGIVGWYYCEVEARKLHYKKRTQNLEFIEANLETIAQRNGAKNFVANVLGNMAEIEITVPDPMNKNTISSQLSEEQEENLKKVLRLVEITLEALPNHEKLK